MDSSTTEKYQIVTEWLKSMFAAGGSGSQLSVPEFEINSETVDLLFQLCTISKRRTQESEIIAEDAALKSMEYQLESKRLASILAGVGIDLGDTSPVHSTPVLRAAISEYIDLSLLNQVAETASLVASLSTALGVNDTSVPALVSAVSDLLLEQRQVREKRRLEKEKIDNLKSVLQDATQTLQSVQKASQQLAEKFEAQRPVLVERQSQLKYLDGKSKEYAMQLQTLKEAVRTSGVTPSIYHSALKQLHSQLTEIESQATAKQNQVNAFKSLPPDTTLAKLKIEETKVQLRSLEEELARSVNGLQLNRLS